MEVELMVTKRDNDRPTNQPTDRVNIEQSASGRLEGRVLQYYQRLLGELYFLLFSVFN